MRLDRGEKAMHGAPLIDAGGSRSHIPQHYVTYHHDMESLSTILSQIVFSEDVLLFASGDEQGMYIQIGIIGQENYQQPGRQYPPKIVYGRKWRIDADTPTSEIIQTAMLAIKKALEHEVRELLTLKIPNKNTRSAPLSNHQDIGMLQKAANYALNTPQKSFQSSTPKQTLQNRLNLINFANHRLRIADYTPLKKGRALVDLQLKRNKKTLTNDIPLPPAFHNCPLSVVVQHNEINSIMYVLVDELIAISDRYVEEQFSYRGFHRFSRTIAPDWIALQSLKSRPYAQHMQDKTFKHHFETLNFLTDQQRKPTLGSGTLAEINTQKLLNVQALNGHLPTGFEPSTLKKA